MVSLLRGSPPEPFRLLQLSPLCLTGILYVEEGLLYPISIFSDNLDPLTLSTELATKLWALKTMGQNGCANLRCTPQARWAEMSAQTEFLTWTDTCSISFEVKK